MGKRTASGRLIFQNARYAFGFVPTAEQFAGPAPLTFIGDLTGQSFLILVGGHRMECDLTSKNQLEKEKFFTAQQLVVRLPTSTSPGPLPTRLFVVIGSAG